ncbi:hypothetical protein [Streptomyces sp. AC512_CC834]|uniref:hypothetical protein n=1 Tax=Streptomyces sp. AC512_CC834 TaxID=2823691 RepID=UPI0020B79330|nr:hypothetical protein [Streptomyces sp. AC512_CC834]
MQRVQFPLGAPAGGTGGKLANTAELGRCFCDETGRRETVVTGGAVVEERPKCGDGRKVNAVHWQTAAPGGIRLRTTKDLTVSISAGGEVLAHLHSVPPAGFEPAHTAPEAR